MTTIQTIIARALVRLAALAAPAELAGSLRGVLNSGGGGGPAPIK